ncbi:putative kinase [Actinokineospora spheciospongiae]|uniref:Putative kinase n=1 Tax=Actinokineospora spheciospongiae TaxID=909613 RepID=W7J8S1_9PSEU|nr:aminoglycoside phosphotransferase family protein [Actinokineospora spheciospongiae]EWC62429.1 putative kinase [Actinokineospora spheciospongiae]
MTDAITAKLVRRFGPGAAEWVATLPALVAECARRWRLEVGEPFDSGASSVAVRATVGGRAAVLKLSPDGPFLAAQAEMLRLFEPSGRMPVLLAEAPGALLLEAVRPGTEVADLRRQPAPEEYAALLLDLHAVEPPDGVPDDVRLRTEQFLRHGISRLGEPALADSGLRRDDFERALDGLDDLFAPPWPSALLHGDLHLGNVLDGGSRGLVAIDPKVCVGDRCWDAVDYVLAGAGRRDGVEYRLRALSTAARIDVDRLYTWCRLVAAATAVSVLLRGGSGRAVDELLALAR